MIGARSIIRAETAFAILDRMKEPGLSMEEAAELGEVGADDLGEALSGGRTLTILDLEHATEPVSGAPFPRGSLP